MKMKTKISLILLIFPLLIYSEKIILKNGRSVYGKIIEENQNYLKINSKFGIIKIPKEKITLITNEKEPLPESNKIIKRKKKIRKKQFKEIFKFGFLFGSNNLNSSSLANYRTDSFLFWNRIGEVEQFFGNIAKKPNTPVDFNKPMLKRIEISKGISAFDVGITYEKEKMLFNNETEINNLNFNEKLKLSRSYLGLKISTRQILKIQLISGFELGINDINMNYSSSLDDFISKLSFISIKFFSGYIADISKFLSVKCEIVYTLIGKNNLNDIFLNKDFDTYYNINRPYFSKNIGTKISIGTKGFSFRAGLTFKIYK